MPDLYGQLTPQGVLNGSLQTIMHADNYNDLINKPSINSVELQGNKTAADLGLLTAGDIPVDSVNGKQGVVILDGDDIEYEAGTSVNSKITDLEAEIGSGPVISVNGQQGVVELDGTDINYSLTKTLNQKIDEVAASIPVVSYPVTSVNTKTGDVVLDDTDIEHSSGVSVNSIINTIASYTPVYGNTASGAIATFDTSLALPLQDCTIAINAVQEGSGTPSPDNVRPITGFMGANIHVADDENPHIVDNITAISWQDEAGTVYGGSLDVTSGKLTVTWGSVDIGSLDWLKQPTEDPNANVFRSFIPNRKYGTTAEIGFPAKISIYNYTINATLSPLMNRLGNFECGGQTTNSAFMIRDDRYNTAEDFKTAMDGIYLYFELATPVTYQLTPTQISAIVGTNNVFTDTNGDTSVMYACSLKDYIDRQ
jgi:hypothetical protein